MCGACIAEGVSMDECVIMALTEAGTDVGTPDFWPTIPILVNDNFRVQPSQDEVLVLAGKKHLPVALKPSSELFVGTRTPPDFARGPTQEYELFFGMLESTVIDYCTSTGSIVTDVEIERLYRHLRRRPDGSDSNPLFSYIRAAARLYMSLRETSRAEFDAVTGRLARSAKTFALGYSSTNYYDVVYESIHNAVHTV